jgi:hypothetical protein
MFSHCKVWRCSKVLIALNQHSSCNFICMYLFFHFQHSHRHHISIMIEVQRSNSLFHNFSQINASSAGVKSSFITIQAGRFTKLAAKIWAPLSRKSMQKVSPICCYTPFLSIKWLVCWWYHPENCRPVGHFLTLYPIQIQLLCNRWNGYYIGFVELDVLDKVLKKISFVIPHFLPVKWLLCLWCYIERCCSLYRYWNGWISVWHWLYQLYCSVLWEVCYYFHKHFYHWLWGSISDQIWSMDCRVM